MSKTNFTICRKCKEKVDKYTTMFGYCPICIKIMKLETEVELDNLKKKESKMYIVCDMNCNNLGNYFECVGHKRVITEDESSFIFGNSYYPKTHCYRSKHSANSFRYSEAIDKLLPEDYVRWQKTMFGAK